MEAQSGGTRFLIFVAISSFHLDIEGATDPHFSTLHFPIGSHCQAISCQFVTVDLSFACRGCLSFPLAEELPSLSSRHSIPISFNPQEYFSPTYRIAEPSLPTKKNGSAQRLTLTISNRKPALLEKATQG
jgi:hypothetical protein